MDALQWTADSMNSMTAMLPTGTAAIVAGAVAGAAALPLAGLAIGALVPVAMSRLSTTETSPEGTSITVSSELVARMQWTAAALTTTSASILGGAVGVASAAAWSDSGVFECVSQWVGYETTTTVPSLESVEKNAANAANADAEETWSVYKWFGSHDSEETKTTQVAEPVSVGLLGSIYSLVGYEDVSPPVVVAPQPPTAVGRVYEWFGFQTAAPVETPVETNTGGALDGVFKWFGHQDDSVATAARPPPPTESHLLDTVYQWLGFQTTSQPPIQDTAADVEPSTDGFVEGLRKWLGYE